MGVFGGQPSTLKEMKYTIEQKLDGKCRLSISKEEWIHLTELRKTVINLQKCRELFDVIIASHLEIEKFMVTSLIEYEFRANSSPYNEIFWNDFRIGLNLRTLTLLTASRCYIDQVPQLLNGSKSLPADACEVFKKILKEKFDESLEYRVMDGCRNYAQHAELPLGGFSINSANRYRDERNKVNSPSRRKLTVAPYFTVAKLLVSQKVRRATRDEIKALNVGKLDLKWFVRKYIGDLSECHKSLFDSISDTASDAQNVLEQAVLRVAPDEKSTFVFLVSEDTDGVRNEQYISGPLFTEALSVKRSFSHIYRGFVSSEINVQKDTYAGDEALLWKPE